jgi:hypothetical protein
MKKITQNFLLGITLAMIPQFVSAQAGEWTWVKGSSNSNTSPSYGTQGEPDPDNTPASVYEPVEWKDHNGNFWLMGGLVNGGNEFNTMWKFDPGTEEWTWVKGSTNCCAPGEYGVQGVPAPGNMPGSRAWGAWSWVDNDGFLWLYGGVGYDDVGGFEVLSDLWKFDPQTEEWAWMDGPTVETVPVYYGTKGSPTANTSPGARAESNASWVDDSNRLWLFGGALYIPQQGGWNIAGFGNDMWMWDPDLTQWTWMAGTSQLSQGGIYGTQGVPDSSNYPPGRGSYSKWEDTEGNFYFFGGYNLAVAYNDLWKYDWHTNVFTWISGPSTSNNAGTFGTQCVPDVNNIPPSRYENRSFWQDTCDHFWLGSGFNSSVQFYNDLWHYNLATNEWTWVSGSNSTNATGSYGTQGQSSPTNVPPARGGNVGWSDDDGNLWLFGGVREFFVSYKNDLWKYVPDPDCPVVDACGVPAIVISTSDTAVCEKFCINYFSDLSTNNPQEWNWLFEGGSPAVSADQNPTGICYDDPGLFDVTLITGDGNGNYDTLVLNNYIEVFTNPFAPSITQTGNTLTASAADSYQWFLNGIEIPGATDQSYTMMESGFYTVEITNENGCNAQSSIKAYLTGMADPGLDFSFSVFPNPAKEEVIISGLLTENTRVAIHLVNTLGQVVLSKEIQLNGAFAEKLQVGLLPPGDYIVQLFSSSSFAFRKIILSR